MVRPELALTDHYSLDRYVYDMLCPSTDDPAYVPKPLDGEVESFEVCLVLTP
jgi:hypothetical protein